MTVRVTVGRLHSWIDERRPDYDERLDPMSDFWMDLDPGWDRCLLCGDFAIDVDELVDANEKRSANCKKCEPCAVCDNCKVTIRGEPVCMGCVEDEEVESLTAAQQRWYSFFEGEAETCRRLH